MRSFPDRVAPLASYCPVTMPMRFLVLTVLVLQALAWGGLASAAELSAREKRAVETVNQTIRTAGIEYKARNFAAAGEAITRAMDQIDIAMKVGSAELLEAFEPAMKRISTAHALLELEGVAVPPFRRPTLPSANNASADDTATGTSGEKPEMVIFDIKDPPSEPPNATPPKSDFAAGVSFTQHVAPILVGRCGRCHVTGSKGGFNMANYEALMKGSRAGVVVFPGDVPNSVLVEVIESGAMPPNGSVSAQELLTLKTWINGGAKFDGPDPTATLSAGSGVAAVDEPTKTAMPEIKQATGKETVSFAGDIAPLLVEACKGCHIDAMQTRGGLQLDTFARMMRGGDSGPIISPGNAADSLLVKKLRGMVGERMPAGGRPAFSEDSIQLISTWINEGATLDGASKDQPLEVMSKLAWMKKASASEISAKRKADAEDDLKLVNASGGEMHSLSTDHFFVTGTASKPTLELVAAKAEEELKWAKTIVDAAEGEEFFHGKATLFVMPRRYDYSEFAKMIEARDVPSDWNAHWKFDGINAYIALVATDRDEDDEIADRLISPLVSLAVATRGMDVPRWFAEGVGASVYSKSGTKVDRDAKRREDAEISAAVVAMKDAKQFLGEKLKPEQTDRISMAIAASMMDRGRRKNFDALMRNLSDGLPFDQAFQTAFRATPAAYITQWLKWVKG
ncbi:c-type cytochrome domain-containing protein [Novipirellula maiorica]|uniref:c-type cytochrome domain-containing protein n=1 Tax=Novipirellula maiorica TaxID=1265734 RepID=UPI00068D7524|nr:c-type cytochrome domain-containing protein [Rhodopirellula maiorica]